MSIITFQSKTGLSDVLNIISTHLHDTKALKWHVDFQKIAKENRYIELCNPFPRIDDPF